MSNTRLAPRPRYGACRNCGKRYSWSSLQSIEPNREQTPCCNVVMVRSARSIATTVLLGGNGEVRVAS